MQPIPRPRSSLLYFYIILAALLTLLGIAGFARYTAWHHLPHGLTDWIYLTLQLIPMESGAVVPPVPLELELARYLIPLAAAGAAVQAFLRIFREQIQALRLPWLRGHIIICGLSRKGFLLAGQFRQQGRQVVVVEQDEENNWIESCRAQGMFVLVGDASDAALLNTAGVLHAEGLFAVCDHDGVNAEIALRAQQLTQTRTGEALTCLLHVSDPQLCGLLREREAGLEKQSPFRLELFNVFERAARRMIQAYPAWDEAPGSLDSPAHILIVGLGRLGENLALDLARSWWNRTVFRKERLLLTVVDRDAIQKSESLRIRYPQLDRACELRSLDMEIHSPGFERADFLLAAPNLPAPTAIYICVDDDALGLHAGLTLSRRIPGVNLPIVIRMAEESGLARLLEFRRNHHPAYRNLFAFGYLEQTCTPGLLNTTPRDLLARAAHEQFVQEQSRAGGRPLQDASVQPWEQLDEIYRKANYQWADHVPALLKQAGYELALLDDWDAPTFQFTAVQVEEMAVTEHELWCRDRQADGWRYAPDEKNLDAKTNPNLVSWERLSEDEREKTRALVSSIPAFVGQAGFQVVKTELK